MKEEKLPITMFSSTYADETMTKAPFDTYQRFAYKNLVQLIRESGKKVLCLDPEAEYEDLTKSLGGCYIDFMSGKYKINPLEPKAWNDGQDDIDKDAPPAFNKVTRLSQHIAFLKDIEETYR